MLKMALQTPIQTAFKRFRRPIHTHPPILRIPPKRRGCAKGSALASRAPPRFFPNEFHSSLSRSSCKGDAS